ncbi:MAG: hemolysin family protein [Trueperella sp.]|nr:hemolysin family protein [Trueperella sp.]
MNIWTALAITVGLLLLNAYFVGAEFALMGARRSRIEPLADAGKRSAKIVLYALEHVTLMLATCQLGVTAASVALGAVAEPAIAQVISRPMHALGMPDSLVQVVAVALALVIVVYLHVVLGEMVPKNLAVTTPETAALIFGPPLVLLSKIFLPIVATLNWVANHAIRLFGFEPKNEVASAFTADEVASIVAASKAAGVLDADVGLISSALEFSEHNARELMVQLDELDTVSPSATPAEIENVIAQTGYSRFPVANSGVLLGYVHLKDIISVPPQRRNDPLPPTLIRTLNTIDGDQEAETALREMQRAGSHMATVTVGGEVQGVIFLEDILEELVGEVRDAMQR